MVNQQRIGCNYSILLTSKTDSYIQLPEISNFRSKFWAKKANFQFCIFTEQERKLFREVEGLIARQTRIKKQILDIPGPKVIQKTIPYYRKSKTESFPVQSAQNQFKPVQALLRTSSSENNISVPGSENNSSASSTKLQIGLAQPLICFLVILVNLI